MTPKEVAQTLREIAQLLLLKGENTFRVRAYETGAEAFEALSPDPMAPGGLLERVRTGTLTDISGVGKGIAEKVEELVKTGTLKYLDELWTDLPRGALDLVRVQGVGPKKALRLIRELDVGNLEDLERVVREGKIRELKGFGEKSEKQIGEGIARLKSTSVRRPLWQTRPAAQKLLAKILALPGVHAGAVAGSVRRFAETNGDLDLIVELKEGAQVEPVMDAFCEGAKELIGRGGTKASIRIAEPENLQADLRVVSAGQFATALHHFTGSKQHHVKLRAHARQLGLTLSEYAVARLEDGSRLSIADETEFYAALQMAYIAPELREDHGEIELSLAQARGEGPGLPQVIERKDVRGLLHVHTKWSDGAHTIEDMARAAKAAGLSWLAITDHTVAAGTNPHMTAERLGEQAKEIAAVQQAVGIRVLRGVEVDILKDGSLDLPDEVLKTLDVVIASLHTRHGLDEAAQTERLAKALSNPHVKIWGHPTGRLLGSREPTSMRMEELLALCAKTGVAVECNGTPERLDLSAEWLRHARTVGARVSISVDAHAKEQVENLDWAIGTARRGWTDRERVVNAREADEFLKLWQ
ncbi:MAG: DNA polymerase/3'-5' exonuclease PolX [Deltaproteobacteria bacterium]|nr:DNA polymerase/3'-5' exonuclease PolX [Deltaproteobacteria bacterium]